MDKFIWVVAFSVDKGWVADGFKLTPEVAQDMIERALPYAHTGEVKACVISAPVSNRIKKAQGYK